VNLEVDLIARYLESLSQRDDEEPGITRELLKSRGYA
jgi:hypothetical protein